MSKKCVIGFETTNTKVLAHKKTPKKTIIKFTRIALKHLRCIFWTAGVVKRN